MKKAMIIAIFVVMIVTLVVAPYQTNAGIALVYSETIPLNEHWEMDISIIDGHLLPLYIFSEHDPNADYEHPYVVFVYIRSTKEAFVGGWYDWKWAADIAITMCMLPGLQYYGDNLSKMYIKDKNRRTMVLFDIRLGVPGKLIIGLPRPAIRPLIEPVAKTNVLYEYDFITYGIGTDVTAASALFHTMKKEEHKQSQEVLTDYPSGVYLPDYLESAGYVIRKMMAYSEVKTGISIKGGESYFFKVKTTLLEDAIRKAKKILFDGEYNHDERFTYYFDNLYNSYEEFYNAIYNYRSK